MGRKLQIILALLLFCTEFQLNAQLNLSWANGAGNNGTEKSLSTVVDGNGDVITTGYFTGKVNFDPGNSNTTLIADGQEDVFVIKNTSSGNFLWVVQIGGPSDEHGTGITFDYNNDYIISGWFQDKPYFDYVNTASQLSSAGAEDAFVCKIDNSGNFVWVSQIGGTQSDKANAIHADSNGDVGITGSFQGTCDFDFGNSANLTATGLNDAFVAKYKNGGGYLWATPMQSSGNDEGYGIWTDSNDDFYVTGYFENTCVFDPSSANISKTSNGLQDIFAIRADNASGKFVWAVQMGGTSSDIGKGIHVDISNFVYLTGSFAGSCDFNPSGGNYVLTSIGLTDAFANKINNSTGAFIWAIKMGGIIDDSGNSIFVANNDVNVTGSFQKTCNFDPTASNTSKTSAGGKDIFIAKYKAATGGFTSADAMGGAAGDDEGLSVYIEPSAFAIYNVGYFNGTSDFDPTSGTTNLVSNGIEDLYIAKYTPCAPAVMSFFSASSYSICSGATTTLTLFGTLNSASSWQLYSGSCGGTNVANNTTGVFTVAPVSNTSYYVNSVGGCVSSTTCLNVNITTNTVPNTSISASSSTACAGQSTTLTASGATTYSWSTGSTNTVIAVSPVVTTNYTVTGINGGCKKTYTTSIAVTALPTITLTGTPSAICPGKSCTLTVTGGVTNYTWNTGATTSSIVVSPTTSTSYSLSGTNGVCSNSKSIFLPMSASPTITAVSNVTILCVGQTATLTANGAATYTWNTGSNSSVILVNPTVTTSYTVTGANGFGCESAPVVLTQSVSTCLGITNLLASNNVAIYPNPNNGVFNVYVSNINYNPAVILFDELGRQVFVKPLTNIESTIDISEFAKGVYILKITNDLGEISHRKLVKE